MTPAVIPASLPVIPAKAGIQSGRQATRGWACGVGLIPLALPVLQDVVGYVDRYTRASRIACSKEQLKKSYILTVL